MHDDLALLRMPLPLRRLLANFLAGIRGISADLQPVLSRSGGGFLRGLSWRIRRLGSISGFLFCHVVDRAFLTNQCWPAILAQIGLRRHGQNVQVLRRNGLSDKRNPRFLDVKALMGKGREGASHFPRDRQQND
jgi:hypothetical protein